MRILKATLSVLIFCGSLHAANQVLPPINFSKGVDYLHSPTEVDDASAVDSQNFCHGLVGDISKRHGSKRFISAVKSTEPINSLFRASASSGTTIRTALIMTTGDKIFYSTNNTAPEWILMREGLKKNNQHFTFTMFDQYVLFTGDALTDPVWKFDLFTSSLSTLLVNDGSTQCVLIRAKYIYNHNNYILLANCKDIKDSELDRNTTYYSNRVYYSLVLQPSSFTAERFIDIGTGEGDEITGISEKQGKIEIYQKRSIYEISYDPFLNLQSAGATVIVTPIVTGFGCVAPYALSNIGIYDVVPSNDGLLLWDGSRRTRLNTQDEVRAISLLVKPLYDRLVQNNTLKNACGFYYPKRKWYVFSFEHPDKFPKGVNNTVFIYDLNIGEWEPQKNWLADSLCVLDSQIDDGSLLYGDSIDGYVHYADYETAIDDSPKELIVDTCDSTVTWIGSSSDSVHVREGSHSIKLRTTNGVTSSSTYKMAVFDFSEWHDKSKITRDDKLRFDIFVSSLWNLTSLRIDLEVADSTATFDQFFTSVTITSGAFSSGTEGWNTIEVNLSSFAINPEWIDVNIESAPFAKNSIYFGMRLSMNCASHCLLSFDNIRIVQNGGNPLEAFRKTKHFNFGSSSVKDFRQVKLTYRCGRPYGFDMDVFSDFGNLASVKNIGKNIPNEIYLCGYDGDGFARLKASDLTHLASSRVANSSDFNPENGDFDGDYLYFQDADSAWYSATGNHRIVKIAPSDLSVFVSSYGSFGYGTTNFILPHSISVDENNVYVTDNRNNRVCIYEKNNFYYLNSFGELGNNTTNIHSPAGIKSDGKNLFIGNDGNFEILKSSLTELGVIKSDKFTSNTVGDISIKADAEFVYVSYNRMTNSAFAYQDVILEKRNRSDLKLVNSVTVRPDGVTSQSTYTARGDIAILGDYVFITFGYDISDNADYYLQKRLKSNFSLVKEIKTKNKIFGVVGDGLSHVSELKTSKINLESSPGEYIQLRFYDEGGDNSFALSNMSFVVEDRGYQE